MNKYRLALWLILIIAAAFIAQLYQVNREFNGYHEYASSHSAMLARNLIEYKAAPISNINPLNDKFYYYLYHPFLDIYYFAFSFLLFGVSATVGRFAAMLSFAAGSLALYFLAANLWSKKVALWSTFFYLFFPVSQYHSKLIAAGTIIPFFMLVFILFYYLWQKENRRRDYYLMLASFILGCLTVWYTYFLAPLIILHYFFVLKKNDRRILALLLVATALLAGHLIVNFALTRSFLAAQPIWPSAIHGTISDGYNVSMIEHVRNDRMKFNLLLDSGYYNVVAGHLLMAFTLPVIIIVLYFLFNYQKYIYLRSPTIYLLFIPATYFIYGALNPKTLMDHFGQTLFLASGAAAICGLVISETGRIRQILFTIIFLTFALFNTIQLYNFNNNPPADIMLGQTAALLTTKQDGIALSNPYFSPLIEFYGDRKFLYETDNLEKLAYVINSGKLSYFVTDFGNLKGVLINRYPAIFLPDNYVLLDLHGRAKLPLKRRRTVQFSNGVSLANWSANRLSKKYLLLEYDWFVQPQPRELFMVFVHFDDENGYQFGQDHYLMNGLINAVKPGQPLKERYVIEIPESLRQKKLSLFIGLYSPVTGVRVQPINVATPDQRVKLVTI